MVAWVTVLIAVVCMVLVVTGVIVLLVVLFRQDRRAKQTAEQNPGYPDAPQQQDQTHPAQSRTPPPPQQ
ncbi:hypothetical protein [Ruania albidiflava]|uniref:hypothetical protein n=1 Tax=Ruania albidiflava TaxID=366586 RepID=UPI0003B79D72|nr:hypothetical protein [Ruania albidiflava]